MFFMILKSGIRIEKFSFIEDFFEARNKTIQSALMPCEMIVASAAPFTPIPNEKIKTGSNEIIKTAQIKIEIIAVFACP